MILIVVVVAALALICALFLMAVMAIALVNAIRGKGMKIAFYHRSTGRWSDEEDADV